MRNKIVEAIEGAFEKLREVDGPLFDSPVEHEFGYDARKLHEVCINHRLANYLEEFLLPLFQNGENKFYVDIEFNKEGVNKKELVVAGQEKLVRPDIIIHNRKSGEEKMNLLIVECKKTGASRKELREDIEKVIAFMRDEKYCYLFGLQVVYGKDYIKGTLFYPTEKGISSKRINC